VWETVASVAASSIIGLAIGFVTFDLLRTPQPAMEAPILLLDSLPKGVAAVQKARG
jgi:hypothetical protein